MKLLATGDWQAGLASISLEEQEPVWHRIVDIAIEQRIDLFLHAGDLVEGPVFTMEQLAAVRRVFARLREARIPIAMTTGNQRHDLAARPVHALDVFKDYPGIAVADRPECLHFDGIDVCALPWVSPARLFAAQGIEADRDGTVAAMTEMLLSIATDLLYASYESAAAKKVLLAHWFISNTALPTGLPIETMREPVLPWADLDAMGFDAVIAGHNHQPTRIDTGIDKTLGIVVGSPQQLSFGEPGEHGIWIVALGNAPMAEFVQIESREFVTLDYRIPHSFLTDPHHSGLATPIQIDGNVVRVRFHATEDEALLVDQRGIRDVLTDLGAHRVQIEPRIERGARARVEAISETLGPLEALALYADANGLPDGLASAMRDRLEAWA